MLKDGRLKGHKRSGKWLIPIDQPLFNSLEEEQDEAPEDFIRYIKDEEHYSIVFDRMLKVSKSLKITTGDLKHYNVDYIKSGDKVHISLAEFFLDLCNNGIKVQIACMKPKRFYGYMHKNFPELEKHPNFTLRQQSHIHMKVFIFDDEEAYIGSANITDAAMGYRCNEKRPRNHEAGILVKGNQIFKDACNHFKEIWNGDGIHKYGYKQYMEDE